MTIQSKLSSATLYADGGYSLTDSLGRTYYFSRQGAELPAPATTVLATMASAYSNRLSTAGGSFNYSDPGSKDSFKISISPTLERVTTITAPSGAKTVISSLPTVDALGQITGSKSVTVEFGQNGIPQGSAVVTTVTLDHSVKAGLQKTTTVNDGSPLLRTSTEPFGLQPPQKRILGLAESQNITITTTDSSGNTVLSVEDPSGNLLSRSITQVTSNAAGDSVTTSTDQNGNTSTTVKDPNGKLISTTNTALLGQGESRSVSTDGSGNVTTVTTLVGDPSVGNPTSILSGFPDLAVTTLAAVYTNSFSQTVTSSGNFLGASNVVSGADGTITTWVYGPSNNLTSLTWSSPNGSSASSDTNGNSSFTDPLGNRLVTDPSGNTTITDGLGNKAVTINGTDASGNSVTTTTYYPSGSTTAVSTSNSESSTLNGNQITATTTTDSSGKVIGTDTLTIYSSGSGSEVFTAGSAYLQTVQYDATGKALGDSWHYGSLSGVDNFLSGSGYLTDSSGNPLKDASGNQITTTVKNWAYPDGSSGIDRTVTDANSPYSGSSANDWNSPGVLGGGYSFSDTSTSQFGSTYQDPVSGQLVTIAPSGGTAAAGTANYLASGHPLSPANLPPGTVLNGDGSYSRTTTDSSGNVTTVTTNGAIKTVVVKNADGSGGSYTFDAAGNETSYQQTNQAGQVVNSGSTVFSLTGGVVSDNWSGPNSSGSDTYLNGVAVASSSTTVNPLNGYSTSTILSSGVTTSTVTDHSGNVISQINSGESAAASLDKISGRVIYQGAVPITVKGTTDSSGNLTTTARNIQGDLLDQYGSVTSTDASGNQTVTQTYAGISPSGGAAAFGIMVGSAASVDYHFVGPYTDSASTVTTAGGSSTRAETLDLANGDLTASTFDSSGNLLTQSVTAISGSTTTFSFSNGSKTTSSTVDATGNVTLTSFGATGTALEKTITAPDGSHVVENLQPGNGHLITAAQYAANGTLLCTSVTDSSGNLVTTAYTDPSGNQTALYESTLNPDGSYNQLQTRTVNGQAWVLSSQYSSNGTLLSDQWRVGTLAGADTFAANGIGTGSLLDRWGNKITDASGSPVTVNASVWANPNGSSGIDRTVVDSSSSYNGSAIDQWNQNGPGISLGFAYFDASTGNYGYLSKTDQSAPATVVNQSGGSNAATALAASGHPQTPATLPMGVTMSANGYTVQSISADGNPLTSAVTGAGTVVTVTRPDNSVGVYTYNGAGKQISYTNTSNSGSVLSSGTATYFPNGQISSNYWSSLDGSGNNLYTPSGQLNNAFSSIYDPFTGDVTTSTQASNGSFYTLTRDASGNVLSSDVATVTTDAAGNPLGRTETNFSVQHDSSGNPIPGSGNFITSVVYAPSTMVGSVAGVELVTDQSGNTLLSAKTILDSSGNYQTSYSDSGYSGWVPAPLSGFQNTPHSRNGGQGFYAAANSSGRITYGPGGQPLSSSSEANGVSSTTTLVNPDYYLNGSYVTATTVITDYTNGGYSQITTAPSGQILAENNLIYSNDPSGNLIGANTQLFLSSIANVLTGETTTSTWDASNNLLQQEWQVTDYSDVLQTTSFAYSPTTTANGVVASSKVLDLSGNIPNPLFVSSTVLDSSGNYQTVFSDTGYTGYLAVLPTTGIHSGTVNTLDSAFFCPGEAGTISETMDASGNLLTSTIMTTDASGNLLTSTTYTPGAELNGVAASAALVDASGHSLFSSSTTTDGSGNFQTKYTDIGYTGEIQNLAVTGIPSQSNSSSSGSLATYFFVAGNQGTLTYDSSGDLLSHSITTTESEYFFNGRYITATTVSTYYVNGNSSTVITDPSGKLISSMVNSSTTDVSGNPLTATWLTTDASGNVTTSTAYAPSVEVNGIAASTTMLSPSGQTLFSASTTVDGSGNYLTAYVDSGYGGPLPMMASTGITNSSGSYSIAGNYVGPASSGTFLFNPSGNLISESTRVIQQNYVVNGEYVTATNLTTSYANGGSQNLITNANGAVLANNSSLYSQDASGNSVFTATNLYLNDSGHFLTGAITANTTDSSNNLLSESLQNTDVNGNLTTSLVYAPSYTVNGVASTTTVVAPSGQTLFSSITTVDPSGNYQTNFTDRSYSGNLQQLLPETGIFGDSYKSGYGYDGYAAGEHGTATFDASGNFVSSTTTTPGSSYVLNGAIFPTVETTTNLYANGGTSTFTTDASGTVIVTNSNLYGRDPSGNSVHTITNFSLDPTGTFLTGKTTIDTFDSSANLLSESVQNTDANDNLTTSVAYAPSVMTNGVASTTTVVAPSGQTLFSSITTVDPSGNYQTHYTDSGFAGALQTLPETGILSNYVNPYAGAQLYASGDVGSATYDPSGNLVSQTDSISFASMSADITTTGTNPVITLNPNFNLNGTYTAATTTSTIFFNGGNSVVTTDASGSVITNDSDLYSQDPSGNTVETITSQTLNSTGSFLTGTVTVDSRDSSGNLLSESIQNTDPNGTQTTSVAYALGTMINGVAATTNVVNHSGQNLFSSITTVDPSGNYQTHYTDSGFAGTLQSLPETGILNGYVNLNRGSFYVTFGELGSASYDPSGNLLSNSSTTTDPSSILNGRATPATTVTSYYSNGASSTVITDPSGNVIANKSDLFTQDASGNQVQTTTNLSLDNSGAFLSGVVMVYTRDGSGNLVSESAQNTDDYGTRTSSLVYGPSTMVNGVAATTTVVDASGQTLFASTTTVDPSGNYQTHYTDSGYAQVVKTFPETGILNGYSNLYTGSNSFANGESGTATFDPSGNFVAQTDSTIITDASNNVVSASINSYTTTYDTKIVGSATSAQETFQTLAASLLYQEVALGDGSGNAVITIDLPGSNDTPALVGVETMNLGNAIFYANNQLLTGTPESDTWNLPSGSTVQDTWTTANGISTPSSSFTLSDPSGNAVIAATAVTDTTWTNSQGVQGTDRMVSSGVYAGSYADTWIGAGYVGMATWNSVTGAYYSAWQDPTSAVSGYNSVTGVSSSDPIDLLHHPSKV